MGNRRGVTLVELLVAMAVLFIVSLGLMETVRIAVAFNVRNAVREEGVRVAEEVMANTRATPFAALSGMVGTSTANTVQRQVRGLTVTYTVQTTLVLPDPTDPDTIRIDVSNSYTPPLRSSNAPPDNNVVVPLGALVRNR